MAVQTKEVVSFNGGECVWSVDYEDGATGAVQRLVAVHCRNDSIWPTRATVIELARNRTATRLVPAGGVADVTLPTGQAQRLEFRFDTRLRVDGIDWRIAWGPEVL